jgi:curved DNA-binding protein CbpA
MRELNEAWAVLRDPERRAAYDRSLRAGAPGPAANVAGRTVVHTPSRDFTPFHDEDADDDDSWRYEPDEYDPATALGRVLSMAPVVLVAVGAALGVVGLVTGGEPGRALVAAGFVGLLLGGLMFVLAPLVAVTRSAHHERHGTRNR